MRKMFTKLALSMLLVGTMLTSCTFQEVADVTITYEVVAETAERPFTVWYTNEMGGENVERNIAETVYKTSFAIPSDQIKSYYDLDVTCWALYEPVYQKLTLTIYEEGKVVARKETGGTSDIYLTSVRAELPTQIVYKDKE